MSWSEGAEDREESLRRLKDSFQQRKHDLARSWRIFTKSFLAVFGLLLVIFVSTVSYFADEIAVEHPYRNLQDTEDLWWIDYEPSRKAPFSEECDWHEQKIDLFDLRRSGNNRTRAWSDEIWSAERSKIIRNPLHVIEILSIENTLGYPLNYSWVVVDPNNDTWLIVSEDVLENDSFDESIWITYEFNNEAMHHSWLPDGYDVCILGTNNEGQDMFSKILYGSRISLTIGFTVALFTVILGTIVGCVSGYFGGRVDEIIMRICDVFFAIPGLILAMAFVAALQATVRLSISMATASLVPLILLSIFFRTKIGEKVAHLENEPKSEDKQLMRVGIPFSLITAVIIFLSSEISLEMAIISCLLLVAIFGRIVLNIPFTGNRYGAYTISIIVILSVFTTFTGNWEQEPGLGKTELLLSRAFPIAVVFAVVIMASILEKVISRRVPISGVFEESEDHQKSNPLGYLFMPFRGIMRNPYKYLTFRTLVISISAALLFSAAGSSEGEFVIIKDFDRLWKIQVALIFTGWPGYARLIRGQVLYVKEMTFIEAAKSVGAPDGRIMFRHILPNAWAPLLVAFTLDIGGTILSASGLSFIGLGAEPGTAEWGILVSEGRRWFPDDWWLITFPGIAIGVTTLGFNLLGDGLRDVVDPKNRR